MLDALRFDSGERPRLVHRLDRDTSGVLVLARTARAAAFLAESFQGRSVAKTYWALTLRVPSPRAGTIDVPLAKAAGEMGREKMEESEEGDRAVTDYRVVEDVVRAAWVELSPRTGRTHQLRAHMVAIGTPIIGDRKYGGAGAILPGIAPKLHLHAAALSLRLPSGKNWHVAAPLPDHMQATWSLLGLTLPRQSKSKQLGREGGRGGHRRRPLGRDGVQAKLPPRLRNNFTARTRAAPDGKLSHCKTLKNMRKHLEPQN
jgi:23S rRNA pseudouridine955/2504/2580 synthase